MGRYTQNFDENSSKGLCTASRPYVLRTRGIFRRQEHEAFTESSAGRFLRHGQPAKVERRCATGFTRQYANSECRRICLRTCVQSQKLTFQDCRTVTWRPTMNASMKKFWLAYVAVTTGFVAGGESGTR